MYAVPFKTETDARIYEALAPLGLVLCGGYCRDMLLGLEPRDMDFVVVGLQDKQEWLEDNWPDLVEIIENLGGEIIKEYFPYASNCVCVVDFKVGERSCQVIFPRLSTDKIDQVVSLFQWNFNHAYFEPRLGVAGGEHVWCDGVKPSIYAKKAIWMCSFEVPDLKPKYKEKLPDWDFSLYEGDAIERSFEALRPDL